MFSKEDQQFFKWTYKLLNETIKILQLQNKQEPNKNLDDEMFLNNLIRLKLAFIGHLKNSTSSKSPYFTSHLTFLNELTKIFFKWLNLIAQENNEEVITFKNAIFTQPIKHNHFYKQKAHYRFLPLSADKSQEKINEILTTFSDLNERKKESVVITQISDINQICIANLNACKDYLKKKIGVDLFSIHPTMDLLDSVLKKVDSEKEKNIFISSSDKDFIKYRLIFSSILEEHYSKLKRADNLLALYHLVNPESEPVTIENLKNFFNLFINKKITLPIPNEFTADLDNQSVFNFIAGSDINTLALDCFERETALTQVGVQIGALYKKQQIEPGEFPLQQLEKIKQSSLLIDHLFSLRGKGIEYVINQRIFAYLDKQQVAGNSLVKTPKGILKIFNFLGDQSTDRFQNSNDIASNLPSPKSILKKQNLDKEKTTKKISFKEEIEKDYYLSFWSKQSLDDSNDELDSLIGFSMIK